VTATLCAALSLGTIFLRPAIGARMLAGTRRIGTVLPDLVRPTYAAAEAPPSLVAVPPKPEAQTALAVPDSAHEPRPATSVPLATSSPDLEVAADAQAKSPVAQARRRDAKVRRARSNRGHPRGVVDAGGEVQDEVDAGPLERRVPEDNPYETEAVSEDDTKTNDGVTGNRASSARGPSMTTPGEDDAGPAKSSDNASPTNDLRVIVIP
jgi:hypothetical protein